MGTKGTTLDDFVAIALVKLVCLVLKLSWMENAEQTKEIMQRLGQFLQVRLPSLLGLSPSVFKSSFSRVHHVRCA